MSRFQYFSCQNSLFLLIAEKVIDGTFAPVIPHRMITILLADNNPTYCNGLKTMLEQVEDFNIVILPPGQLSLERMADADIDVLLLDVNVYLSIDVKKRGAPQQNIESKTILLTMEHDEIPFQCSEIKTIAKGSRKKDFEEMIRHLTKPV
jgi:DNA-binding NarL/FixJ family response regulator